MDWADLTVCDWMILISEFLKEIPLTGCANDALASIFRQFGKPLRPHACGTRLRNRKYRCRQKYLRAFLIPSTPFPSTRRSDNHTKGRIPSSENAKLGNTPPPIRERSPV
jgi:hypothetical protein